MAYWQTTLNSVSILGMRFVFPFCTTRNGDVVIPISINTWHTEASKYSDFVPNLPVTVDLRYNSEKLFTESARFDTTIRFYSTKFTLRNLVKYPNVQSAISERGIAEFLFPNFTFVDIGTSLHASRKYSNVKADLQRSLDNVEYFTAILTESIGYPLLRLRIDENTMLQLWWDQYTFKTCGTPRRDNINFYALFTPFGKLTWGLIFGVVFGWPLVISIIENNFKWRSVLNDADALFIGWAMLFEQSHPRSTNYTGRKSLYSYYGTPMMAFLVLSNAYKGENIKSLAKNFAVYPFQTLEQLQPSN